MRIKKRTWCFLEKTVHDIAVRFADFIWWCFYSTNNFLKISFLYVKEKPAILTSTGMFVAPR